MGLLRISVYYSGILVPVLLGELHTATHTFFHTLSLTHSHALNSLTLSVTVAKHVAEARLQASWVHASGQVTQSAQFTV